MLRNTFNKTSARSCSGNYKTLPLEEAQNEEGDMPRPGLRMPHVLGGTTPAKLSGRLGAPAVEIQAGVVCAAGNDTLIQNSHGNPEGPE